MTLPAGNPFTLPVARLPKLRSPALINATHEMPCSLRFASFLGRRCEGSVMAVHLDMAGGKGIGTKVSDLCVVAGCDACHKLMDGRDRAGWEVIMNAYPAAAYLQVIRAINETHSRLLGAGVIKVKGQEVLW